MSLAFSYRKFGEEVLGGVARQSYPDHGQKLTQRKPDIRRLSGKLDARNDTSKTNILKHIILTVIFASTVAHAEDRSFSEKARAAAEAVVGKTREVARDTKELVSDELPVYRAGANEPLAVLGKQIIEVKTQMPIRAPIYLGTVPGNTPTN